MAIQRRIRVFQRSWQLLLVVPALGALQLRAQGGPPVITDEPGTPGNRNGEINLGWIAEVRREHGLHLHSSWD